MKKKKLLFLYIAGGMIWIFGTNFLLDFAPAPFVYEVERFKEIFYVAISGWFFYFYISKAEELNASKQDEKRLSTLINAMVDFVNFKDGEGRWIEANEFGLKLFQLENVDYRGKKDSELAKYTDFYGDALRYCEISDEETWQHGKVTSMEEIIPQPDGTNKTFDTIKVPLFNNDGSRKGLVIIGRDITERKQMENLLQESRQQYKSLFEYNPDIVTMLDLNGNITNVNPQCKIITGYDASEFIGKNIKGLLPNLKKFILETIQKVIFDKKPELFELEIVHKLGHNITLHCTALPIIVNGEISGIICYGRDVTQLKMTEERLRRTEKLSVVGELSASVAHEIRNPLTSLKGFVQLLQMEDEKHQLYYKIMTDELNRINHIVGELLLLAKPQRINFTKANVQQILSDIVSLLQTEASMYNVDMNFSSTEEELWIECEPNQLKQLFVNVIKNALEASTNGGKVSISLENGTDENVWITVNDDGCGISKERLEKIGEPFYSSKEKGTGLGLTVSYKIVQAHNGKITFKSELNHGTAVNIKLPISHSR